eukprot:TRINITY_DN11768_c0_g1_i4.p1 TRINITY_DN11768_c0_g1~~TRINITY_DN11768_c0_g1_i4.p1  ORF type:complete len:208 (-),score=57.86 TRINITY_DN11768_c0_g1_i4:229-792(-)
MCIRDSNKGEGSLHYSAIGKGNGTLYIKFFIEQGANIEDVDHSGNTPLSLAASRGIDKFHRIIKLLLERGADPNHKNRAGKSLIDYLEADKSCSATVRDEIMKLVQTVKRAEKPVRDPETQLTQRVVKKSEQVQEDREIREKTGEKAEEKRDLCGTILLVAYFVVPLMGIILAKIYEDNVIPAVRHK